MPKAIEPASTPAAWYALRRVACYEVFHDTAALWEALADTELRNTP